MWRATFGLLWRTTSDVHSTAGNRQRRREVGYHARLGERRKRRHSGEEELVCERSLRSTVEGSGSPFADELHYLWASRGNELAPRTQQESDQRLLQRLSDTEAHIGPQSTGQTPSMADPRRTLTLLASWSVASKEIKLCVSPTSGGNCRDAIAGAARACARLFVGRFDHFRTTDSSGLEICRCAESGATTIFLLTSLREDVLPLALD